MITSIVLLWLSFFNCPLVTHMAITSIISTYNHNKQMDMYEVELRKLGFRTVEEWWFYDMFKPYRPWHPSFPGWEYLDHDTNC
jgi:hypothetical protein